MTTSRTVTVGTEPTRLDTTADEPDSSYSGTRRFGQKLWLYNAGGASVYLGGADVTTSTGYPVGNNSAAPPLDLNIGDALYGVCASGTNQVIVLETRV
jgi:hypothetical protein